MPDDIAVAIMLQYYGRSAPQVYPQIDQVEKAKRRRLLAGGPRWGLWRGEALYWLSKYFRTSDKSFDLTSRKCAIPHAKHKWNCKNRMNKEEAAWLVKTTDEKCAGAWESTAEVPKPKSAPSAVRKV
jgi:hypothetical protein